MTVRGAGCWESRSFLRILEKCQGVDRYRPRGATSVQASPLSTRIQKRKDRVDGSQRSLR